MLFTPLYDPSRGQMRIAGFMSGSGSNIRKIIEHEKRLKEQRGKSPFHVSVIFTDDCNSFALTIGKYYDLPVVMRDKRGFYKAREKPLRDLAVRSEFDRETVRALSPYDISVAAYGGYMSIATEPLIDAFLGVNVHPADLTILGPDGKRKYKGEEAVRDAILAGERKIRSTTHIMRKEVDGGEVLMVSAPLDVVIPEDFHIEDGDQVKKLAKAHQDKLKEVGDWDIFPKTLEDIADGRYTMGQSGALFLDEYPIPKGLRL